MQESPPASQAVLSRMLLTLHVSRRTPHGASRLVHAESAWSIKTRHAPSRRRRDAMAYGHTTMSMHDIEMVNEITPQSTDRLLLSASCVLWTRYVLFWVWIALIAGWIKTPLIFSDWPKLAPNSDWLVHPPFGVPMSLAYPCQDVAKHNSRESAWVIIKDKVYDITRECK